MNCTFCDAYGTYVVNSECEKCKLRCDCIKVKIPELKNKSFRTSTPYNSTI